MIVQSDTSLEELTSFEQSRQGKVVLTGTEDFQFSIEPDGRSGAIWVAIVLNKYFIASSLLSFHHVHAVPVVRGLLEVMRATGRERLAGAVGGIEAKRFGE